MILFRALAEVMDSLEATSSRNKKIEIIGEFLRTLDSDEIYNSSLFIAGRIFSESDSRKLNVSWKSMMDALGRVVQFSRKDFDNIYSGDIGSAVEMLLQSDNLTRQVPLFSENLTILAVDGAFDKISQISGAGSKKQREDILVQLFQDATPKEAKYLVALLTGDTRTGVSDGILAEGVAFAFQLDPEIIRKAWSFTGDLGEVAKLAKLGGKERLSKVGIEYFRPVKPMLASPAEDLESILSIGDNFAFETKLDGARVQIHKQKNRVEIYSRRLEKITESLPEIVEIINSDVDAESVILDGEALAVDNDGKPFPFQVIMRRFGRVREPEIETRPIAIKLIIFDILKRGMEDIVDQRYTKRREMLQKVLAKEHLIDSKVIDNLSEAQDFFEKTKRQGHEGIVAKKVSSKYTPGVRGKNWFKFKHTLETLDLVIVSAEWGYGRRSDWLSDYHLGVRDQNGKLWEIGKTFKGLTDVEFEEMTKKLLSIETGRKRGIVFVKPEVIVEVLADEIQESPKYESGMALRFARIKAIRDDKGIDDATSLEALRKMYNDQFKHKARY